ncbi:MAG: ATP-binding protein [Planctomycetota bacterium]
MLRLQSGRRHRLGAWLIAVGSLVAATPPAQRQRADEIEQALAVEGATEGQRLTLMLRHAGALLRVHLPTALTACETARAEAERLGKGSFAALALGLQSLAVVKMDGAEAALTLLWQARARLPAGAPARLRGRLAHLESALYYILDQYGTAAVRLREALNAARSSGDQILEARCLVTLHDLLRATGNGNDPADDLRSAEALLAQVGAQADQLRVELRWADYWAMQGYEPRAQRAHLDLIAKARAIGDRATELAALGSLYHEAFHSRDWAGAIELGERHIAVARELGDREQTAFGLDMVAWANLHSDQPERAHSYLQEALQLAEVAGLPALRYAVVESARMLALERGDGDALLQHSRELHTLERDTVAGAGAEDRDLADRVLRELRGDRRGLHAMRRAAREAQERTETEHQQRLARYRWVASSIALLLVSTIAVSLYLGRRRAARNARARQRLEDQVRQLERLDSVGLLAAGIAHDFNNILCGILGHAELLTDNPEVDQSSVTTIIAETQRASALCNRLLDYATPSVQPEVVDLRRVIRETQQLLEAAGEGPRLLVEVAAEPIFASVDRSAIQQVLINLAANARHPSVGATQLIVRVQQREAVPAPDNRRVWFGKVPKAKAYAVLEIEDNGSGIDEAHVRRIFDPFFTTKFAGRGLGLSAAYGIIASHGGAFVVTNNQGSGTVFAAYLPLADRPPRRQDHTLGPREEPPASRERSA